MTVPPSRPPSGRHAEIWRLAGPITLSNLSIPLLGAVDTAVVGHLPDPANIGGVAVGALIFSFLYWGFGFLRMGTTGFTAQAFGAGDAAELRACLHRPLILAVALGALMILIQAPIVWISFQIVGASPEVETHAAAYFDIRIWGAPAALLNYTLLGWLLGTQRATAALLLQGGLNGVKILLDLLFVLGFGWGIEGVAWATFIAENGAALAGLALVAGPAGWRQVPWDWPRIFLRERLVALFRVNLDIFIRTAALHVAFIYFTAQSARAGDVVLAANTILLHLFAFTAYGLDGFAHAVEILAGAALGARSRLAFRRAVKTSSLWALIAAGLITLIFWIAGPGIIALFTNLAEVRSVAENYLVWMVAAPLLSVWGFQLDGIFIGTTRTAAMRNAMVLSLATYFAACFLLIPVWNNHGLWMAMLIFMIARAVTLALCYPALERSVEPA